MRRREFIAGLVSAALWPLVAQAQQPVIPIVGFLNSQSERRQRSPAGKEVWYYDYRTTIALMSARGVNHEVGRFCFG
jgi:hypothetical protein